ncbi:MAG: TonB-dependent receptor [Candidatus Omnitrophica bacterium]|nr:TonB-dependent receptor [Candidatus Omnitrophota bacterium]
MKKKILSLLGIILVVLIRGNVLAEEKKYDLGKIIVTATKTLNYQAEVGSSTTVISEDEIKRSGKQTVYEVLKGIPGVAVVQNSAFGGVTSIYLRGAKAGQTLVLIDGVEVNDPMSTDRSFDFAHLTVDNIERIEIVRGPQSTLYGSDAMGGVINIITKKGEGKPTWNGYFEGGSHNTFRENLGLSGSLDRFNYYVSVSRLDSNGINKVTSGSEDDGYSNTVISSKMCYKLFDNSELSLVARFTDAKTYLDDGSYDDDPNYTAYWRDLSFKSSFSQSINSWWLQEVSFSYHDLRRKYLDEKDVFEPNDYENSWYKGNNKKFEWQHNFTPADWDTITCGFEYEEEMVSSYYYSESVWGPYESKFDRKKINNKGWYLQNQLMLWDYLFITPGFRADVHQLFGTETNYKISTAYIIPNIGLRLKANWGTGFKAPSLYQLYSNYGSPELKPDESKSYDFGFEQNLLDNKVSFGLTYFHNDFKNMIDWDSATWKYKNIGKAKTKGFELQTKFSPYEKLTMGANFTYTDTKDKITGLELLRRPKRQANFDVNWRFLPKANLNIGITYVGIRKDTDYTSWPSELITKKAYTTVGLTTSYDITENFHVLARFENIFDKKYQDVHGYNMPPREFYGGIKINF